MNLVRLLFASLVLTVAGCAALGSSSEPDAEVRMQQGLQALAQNDIAAAQRHFEWVYTSQAGKPIAYEALLALIATEMDPRNPGRKLYASSELSERLIRTPDAPAWMRPLGNTFYLLALELGANEERMAQSRLAEGLPKLQQASLAAQLKELRDERDALLKRNTDLVEQLEKNAKELKDSRTELERLKKIIRGS
jgi:hypothetical protein